MTIHVDIARSHGAKHAGHNVKTVRNICAQIAPRCTWSTTSGGNTTAIKSKTRQRMHLTMKDGNAQGPPQMLQDPTQVTELRAYKLK